MYFDIGANVGNWSLANLKNAAKIVAVEASPNTFNSLIANLNSYSNIATCLNYAVCANDEKDIVFYECSANPLSTINKNWLTSESSRFYNIGFKEIICKTITIDKLIKIYGVPDLIKIDVEGGEYECIRSLTQKVPQLCFEWASEMNDLTFKSLDYLHDLGFSEFFIQYDDTYTFRPQQKDYETVEKIKQKLAAAVPKKDWGMIWCI